MEVRARVTSKGQVTIPVEVRRDLGIEEGDVLVFETAGAYATVRRRRPTLEVVEEVRALYLAGRVPRRMTNREAIEEHFAVERVARAGEVVYVSSGDGTFEGTDTPQPTDDDTAR